MSVNLKEIDIRLVNPSELMGTTTRVEDAGNPNKFTLAVVSEPYKQDRRGRRRTVLITQERHPKTLVFYYSTFIRGGVEHGRRLPGVLDEIVLRLIPPAQARNLYKPRRGTYLLEGSIGIDF